MQSHESIKAAAFSGAVLMVASLLTGFAAPQSSGQDREGLQERIDAMAAAGGGRVVVPPGRHLVGQIDLRSNVELHLAKGAVLEGKVGLENYRVTTLPYSEGTWSAVVSAIGVTNVSITGEGEIFGNGTAWPQPEDYGGNQEGRRPRGVFFADCKGIRLSDFTLRDAACWGVVFKCCEDVDVRRLTIDTHANANNDGIDLEAKNVIIADCDIDAGDDAVCLKSNTPDFIVENVLVTNVTARSHCNALKLGTASHGTMRNILFVDCRTESPRRDLIDRRFGRTRRWYEEDPGRVAKYPGAVFGEASGSSAIVVENVDGGTVENVTYRNIAAYGSRTPIFVRAGTRLGRSCGTPPSNQYIFRNITLENITGEAMSAVASSVTGVSGCRIGNVTLRNIRIVTRGRGDNAVERTRPVPEVAGKYPDAHMFDCMLPAYGLYVRHVDDLSLENVTFALRDGDTDRRETIVQDDVVGADRRADEWRGLLEETSGLKPWMIDPANRPVDATERPADPVPTDMKLFLLIGQSNMAGCGELTDEDRRPISRCLKLNRDGVWVESTSPLHFDRGTAGYGLANEFVRRYLADHPSETVGLIPCAVGGSPLITWSPVEDSVDPIGTNYRTALKRARQAQQNGQIVGILWHQGEADSARIRKVPGARARYVARLTVLAEMLRQKLDCPTVPFLIGEIGTLPKDHTAMNPILAEAAAAIPNARLVKASDLTGHQPDNVHFDTPSYRILGARYYEAWVQESQGLTEERGIPYSDASPMCTLNIKWPAGQRGFATVVNFHGGGLTGDGSGYARWPEEAGTTDGVAHVGVRYRLLPKSGDNGVAPGDCLADAAAAVAWTLENIEKYGGDPKKVFVTGVSAGGYLTAMIGMDPKWLAKYGHAPLDLRGIAPLTGQVTKHFNVRSIGFGDTDPRYAPKVDEWAPLYWVKNMEIPPAWFMTGGRHDGEMPCRVEENEFLVVSLLQTGHKDVEFHETEGSHNGGVRPSSYFLRDFVMKYGDIGGIGRIAQGECLALKGASAEVAAKLQLFQALMKPDMHGRVYPAEKADRPTRTIQVRPQEQAGDIARRMCYESLVAQVAIDAKNLRVWPRGNKEKRSETKNAAVGKPVRRGEGVAFDYEPKSLPLPLAEEFASFNREIILIQGLDSGLYMLSFDGREVGRYTAEAFAQGVNVAALDTPNRRRADQAAAVAAELAACGCGADAQADDLFARLTSVRPAISRVTVTKQISPNFP